MRQGYTLTELLIIVVLLALVVGAAIGLFTLGVISTLVILTWVWCGFVLTCLLAGRRAFGFIPAALTVGALFFLVHHYNPGLFKRDPGSALASAAVEATK